jgi:hypothetical protein
MHNTTPEIVSSRVRNREYVASIPWVRALEPHKQFETGEILERLLLRMGVDSQFLFAVPDVTLPSGAREYLNEGNPRLLSLKREFVYLPSPALHHSVWRSERLIEDLPLQRFRDDCLFLWQKRDLNTPISMALTALYLERSGLRSMLERCGEDDCFGCLTIQTCGLQISRDLLDSISEISFVDRMIGLETLSGKTVLDIGSGYGRFAHRLVQTCPRIGKVFCVDAIPEASFLCEYYLDHRGVSPTAEMIPLAAFLRQNGSQDIEVAVNVHSFSECTLESIRWWISLLAERSVPHIFIVPNMEDNVPPLASYEVSGERKDYLSVLVEYGYRLDHTEPKYLDPFIQRFGISPGDYYWFTRR